MLVLTCLSVAAQSSLTLAWNPSVSTNVVGYILYYGLASGQYFGATNVGAATSATFNSLPPGTYYLAVTGYDTNGVQTPLSNEVTNTIAAPAMLIAETPAQSALVGGSVVLYVDVLGDPPITFQWFNSLGAIPGATNSLLQLPNATAALDGQYYVVVSNPGGTVTSDTMQVTITNLPILSLVSGDASAEQIDFTNVAGAYNGLFAPTNADGSPAVGEQNAGMLCNYVLTTNGEYQGELLMAGGTYPFSGVLDSNGQDTATVSRGAWQQPDLSVSLSIAGTPNDPQLTGLVSNTDPNNTWIAPLTARLAAPATISDFTAFLGSIWMGRAAALAGISRDGVMNITGLLPDNTPFQKTVPTSADGAFPLFVSLDHNGGLLDGWVNFSNGVPYGMLTWIEPAPGGEVFTNTLELSASPH